MIAVEGLNFSRKEQQLHVVGHLTWIWYLAVRLRMLSSGPRPSVKWRSATWTTSSSGLRCGCTGVSFMGGISGCPTRRQKGSARASRHSSHRKCCGSAMRSAPMQSQCCHTRHERSCIPENGTFQL